MRADWDDDIAILSGENVSFAIETAGLASRFAASGIDLFLQLLLAVGVGFAFTYFVEGLGQIPTAGPWLAAFGQGALYVLLFVVMWGYYFLFEWLGNGQTPGKRWVGLRVVETSGLPVTLWSAFIRNAMRVVDFLPPPYGLGALVAILNPHNRRLGDLAAGTVVARERREAGTQVLSIDRAVDAFLDSLSVAPAPASPSPLGAVPTIAATLPRLSHEEWELLTGFLRRRASMAPVARDRLARRLSIQLAPKLGPAPPGREEAWLEEVARAAGE